MRTKQVLFLSLCFLLVSGALARAEGEQGPKKPINPILTPQEQAAFAALAARVEKIETPEGFRDLAEFMRDRLELRFPEFARVRRAADSADFIDGVAALSQLDATERSLRATANKSYSLSMAKDNLSLEKR